MCRPSIIIRRETLGPKGIGQSLDRSCRWPIAESWRPALRATSRPRASAVREHRDVIAAMLDRQFRQVEAMLLDAGDITAFAVFRSCTGKEIWSTARSSR
jgi:hypothetical protein